MPGMATCWSCLKKLSDRNAVWISDEHSIPCCKTCWVKMPPARRVELALDFHDRSDVGLGIAETLDEIRDAIHATLGGYAQKRVIGGEEGLN